MKYNLGIDQKIIEKAQYWSESSGFDLKTRTEVLTLLNSENGKEIEDRFYRDLEFGTGGLRGIIGAGTNRINIYNIRRASMALGTYVKKMQTTAIAITHDSRNFSREFAEASAEVFAALGFTVYITKDLRPVPMLSFMTRFYKCAAGVCVTASHNPPQYNGYKVYWSDGAQVVSPHDKNIIAEYEKISDYSKIPLIKFADGVAQKKILIVSEELDSAYFARIKSLSFDSEKASEAKDKFKIVYTPLHGSGLFPVTKALEIFGFKNITVVPEQEKPDGDFPTVKSPNPEEKDAMSMAVALGEKIHADLLLATDPDADRIGFVVQEEGRFKFFNGNQIGCLLIEYFLRRKKEYQQLPKNAAIIKTIVTTDLQREIAKYYQTSCFETLTGFKWICALIAKWEQSGEYKYICGGEESYGFLADSFVRDKDGVASCAIASEMVFYFKQKNQTLSDVLDEIFSRHGIYWETLLTVTLPGKDGAEKIKRIMNQTRLNPPVQIAGIKVKNILDYELSQKYQLQENHFKALESLTLPKSDVLQFKLEDGSSVSIRPSGTEPKIKFYVSVCELSAIGTNGAKLQELKEATKKRTTDIESEFVKLTQNIQ